MQKRTLISTTSPQERSRDETGKGEQEIVQTRGPEKNERTVCVCERVVIVRGGKDAQNGQVQPMHTVEKLFAAKKINFFFFARAENDLRAVDEGKWMYFVE